MVKNVVGIRDGVNQQFEQTNAKYKAVTDKHHELKYLIRRLSHGVF